MEINKSNETTTPVAGATSNGREDEYADKPIMRLFRNLIWSDSKENTVLTNAQITELLEKDFGIDTDELHELELDIYLHIVKRFLKEWPQWDEFDPIINKLRNGQDKTELDKYLQVKYDQLKHYLTVMLEVAQPGAKEKVKEVEEEFSKEKTMPNDEDVSDVLLEIHCSRQQLNGLFYNKPHPDRNLTLFNANMKEPTKIPLSDLSYSAVLNWLNVSIVLKFDTVHIVRSTVYQRSHTLINRKLPVKQEVKELNMNFQEKCSNASRNLGHTQFNKHSPLSLPDVISLARNAYEKDNSLDKQTFSIIFETLEKDLNKFPNEDSYKDMVWYRKYFFKYPYIRNLYTKIDGAHDDNSKKYDIRLRESIKPMYQIHVIKLEPYLNKSRLKKDIHAQGQQGIYLECRSCPQTLKLTGYNCLEQLKQHVLEMHYNEPDWQCMKCKETFAMGSLADSRWRHVCNSDNACL